MSDERRVFISRMLMLGAAMLFYLIVVFLLIVHFGGLIRRVK